MSEVGKILKVTLEFEHQTISLEGKDAERWQSMANSGSVMAQIHGAKFERLPWRVIKKGDVDCS